MFESKVKIKYLTSEIRKLIEKREQNGIDNPEYNQAIMDVLNIIEKPLG